MHCHSQTTSASVSCCCSGSLGQWKGARSSFRSSVTAAWHIDALSQPGAFLHANTGTGKANYLKVRGGIVMRTAMLLKTSRDFFHNPGDYQSNANIQLLCHSNLRCLDGISLYRIWPTTESNIATIHLEYSHFNRSGLFMNLMNNFVLFSFLNRSNFPDFTSSLTFPAVIIIQCKRFNQTMSKMHHRLSSQHIGVSQLTSTPANLVGIIQVIPGFRLEFTFTPFPQAIPSESQHKSSNVIYSIEIPPSFPHPLFKLLIPYKWLGAELVCGS